MCLNLFNQKAKAWDKKPNRLVLAEKFAKCIRQSVVKQGFSTAFEYGCGTGNVSLYLQDCFDKVVLADSSIGMIDEAQRKIEAQNIQHFYPKLLDLEKEDYPYSFDAIYTLMTLHHVKDVSYVIRKLSKMLNLGGMLFIGDLVPEDGDFHSYPENQEVHYGFNKSFIDDLFKQNNLKTIKYHVFHEITKEHTGISKVYPIFTANAIKIQ
ncbi:MAG: methyltransferase domain-containing protein [Bacteroidetes bacterium]|jgi:ubiquinone/menaquinone biosynthesis C-methylase UbiE|nr:methyltransferase domain-containing protein [Bacteroidota bacterium]